MNTTWFDGWEGARRTYSRFWRGEKLGRPIICLEARRKEPLPHDPVPPWPKDPVDKWLDPEFVIPWRRAAIAQTLYLGDAFPVMSVDLGPGSLAAYIGSRAECTPETVWFHPVMRDISDALPEFDRQNKWWRRHLALVRPAAEAARGEGFLVAIPDLIEGPDTLASLRGAQELVMDMMLSPGPVHRHMERITELYFRCYDPICEIVRDEAGWTAATYLKLWGPGRTGKLQCDFAALMNPELFREFAVPYLALQASKMDNVAYHLDGPGAIFSTRMVAEIENIRVVQWMPGQGHAPAWDERWDGPVFDEIVGAGKVIQLHFNFFGAPPGEPLEQRLQETVHGCDRLIGKYGPDAFWFVIAGGLPEELGRGLMAHAGESWRA